MAHRRLFPVRPLTWAANGQDARKTGREEYLCAGDVERLKSCVYIHPVTYLPYCLHLVSIVKIYYRLATDCFNGCCGLHCYPRPIVWLNAVGRNNSDVVIPD